MVKVARYIQDLHPHIVAVGCGAHATQLLFTHLSREPSVEAAHKQHLDIIAYLRVPDQYLRLIQKQRDGDRGGEPVLMLIRPGDTRWSSNVDSLERSLRLWRFIEATAADPTQDPKRGGMRYDATAVATGAPDASEDTRSALCRFLSWSSRCASW